MRIPPWQLALVGLSLWLSTLLGAVPALAQSQPVVPVGENPLQAPPQERAAALARPAIVYIKEKFTGYVISPRGIVFNNGLNNGKPFEFNATCTGFGVNPDGYIATAGHCVDTTGPKGIKYDIIAVMAAKAHALDSSINVQGLIKECLLDCTVEGELKGSPPDGQISVVGEATGNGSPQTRSARVVNFLPADQGDVALLKIDATDQPSIELAGNAQAQIGTPVLSIGYPGNTTQITDPPLEPTNKDGQISSKKTVGTVSVYEVSAAMTEGMSGGPAIGLDGRVLGLNSFKVAGETQQFNFIAPAAGLTELLNRSGVHNQLGPNDLTYRQGLTDYFSGHYTSAIADFDKLLAVSPNQAQALQYKILAAKARDQFGDVSRVPWLWIFLGIAILVVLAAISTVWWLLRRRRRSNHQEGTSLPPADGRPASSYESDAFFREGTGLSTPPVWLPPPRTGEPYRAGSAPTAGFTPAAEGTAPGRFCPSCGNPQNPSARFCADCGVHQH